jgi:hypothetical protein
MNFDLAYILYLAKAAAVRMDPNNLPAWQARLTRPKALLLLALAVVGTGWCLAVALSRGTTATSPPGDDNDLALYRSIVERVHSGENYYDAYQNESRSRGYPTRSIFNWRTPLCVWLIGALPHPWWAQALLGLCALATVLLAYAEVRRESGVWAALATAALLVGALTPCLIADVFLYPELWAGTLIALSAAACASGRCRLGAAAGLLALFLRELALPYCGLALLLAVWRKRGREAAVWGAGLALYGLYFLLHAIEVTSRITDADQAQRSGWVQFGGVAFILETARMNALLMTAPPWVAAVCLPLALLALAGWRGRLGSRVGPVVAVYIAAFAVVGQPFNSYWGLMYAPLLTFGFVRAPWTVFVLLGAVYRPKARSEERQVPRHLTNESTVG